MARKRKKHEEEHENLERWLVSYADFITLLFAFFVIMYAISRVDEQKMGSAVESLQRALGSLIPVQVSQRESGAFTNRTVSFNPTIIGNVEGQIKTSEVESFQKLSEEIQREVEKLTGGVGKSNPPSDSQIKYLIDKRGLVIRVPEAFFFKSGEASIRQEFTPILNALGKSLEKIPNHIRIEGHTDSIPINNYQFPSNWELSTTRATSIVRYFLANHSIPPGKISATGYGEFRPIAPNKTPEGRMQNRRVDVVVLSTKEGETEPPEEKAPTTPPAVQFPRPTEVGR
ncbi:MAG: OmpA family protein [Deltaproteobacteria bacterium]|nr:OmpA family protein [Deltaproteobacteria bacterium]